MTEKVTVKDAFKMFGVGFGYLFYYLGKLFAKITISLGKFTWKMIENANKPKTKKRKNKSSKKKR